MSTQFTVRKPGGNPWDPTLVPRSRPAGCTTKTFTGFNGNLRKALDKTNANYNATVAANFRQWVPLCTIPYAPGRRVHDPGQDQRPRHRRGNGHNRFGLRAFSSAARASKDKIYFCRVQQDGDLRQPAERDDDFYLAQVPTGSGGQILNVRLFDVGDSAGTGTIQVRRAARLERDVHQLHGDRASIAATCPAARSRPIRRPTKEVADHRCAHPSNYTCDDAATTECWVRLKYVYGSGNQPNDITSWSASSRATRSGWSSRFVARRRASAAIGRNQLGDSTGICRTTQP